MSLLNRKSGSSQPSGKKHRRDFTIENRLGLHARPSARFVKVTTRYKSEIWVEKDGEKVNGKSIMGLMMLAAGQGSVLTIIAEGPDAEKALDELEALIKSRFDEDP
jgi:phosphocarrier protein HPr